MQKAGRKPKVHIAGIGGEGWSSIAKILIEKGWNVSGCDLEENERVKALERIGLTSFYKGNSFQHIYKGLDYFLYTSAIKFAKGKGSDELEMAKKIGIPAYERKEFFPVLLKDKEVIAFAGTHGKTTTSSLIAFLLDALGDQCGFIVGGTINNFGTNSRSGLSKRFIVEADEFGDAFLGLNQKVGVITSLEWDHPDFFKTYDDYLSSFQKFANQTEKGGFIVGFGDSSKIRKVLEKSDRQTFTYGESADNDLQICSIRIKEFNTTWKIRYKCAEYKCEIDFPGRQYAYNASAALLVCALFGYELAKVSPLLKKFAGAGRRFQKFEKKKVVVISDYGHHPTELRITVEGALASKKKILVLYEPHQYKRSYGLKDDFKEVFEGVDYLVQTGIFASRESLPYPITGEEFFKITKLGVPKAEYVEGWKDAVEVVSKKASEKCLILVFAVGHGDEIVRQLLRKI